MIFPQPPVYWERLNSTTKALTNPRVLTNSAIQQYNSESSRVFRSGPVTVRSTVVRVGETCVQVWSSLARLGEGTLEEMEDGFHLTPLALTKATQMILNLVT